MMDLKKSLHVCTSVFKCSPVFANTFNSGLVGWFVETGFHLGVQFIDK